jgi:hypothetical protein
MRKSLSLAIHSACFAFYRQSSYTFMNQHKVDGKKGGKGKEEGRAFKFIWSAIYASAFRKVGFKLKWFLAMTTSLTKVEITISSFLHW